MTSTSRFALHAFIVLFATSAFAQAKAPAQAPAENSAVGSSGPILQFNTGESPANSDHREPIKFKGVESFTFKSEDAPATPVQTSVTDDDGFKTYIGYPKHELGFINTYDNINLSWAYDGKAYNFSSSTLVYGLKYQYVATPMWKVGVHYSRYEVETKAGRVTPFNIDGSKATLQQYGIDTEYCLISSKNFFRQYCLGGTLMSDSYPVLKFVTGSRLAMSSVSDIVAGVHLAAQLPFSEKVFFKPILGYNYGTGAGNSGALSPVNNSKFYFRAEVPWLVTRQLTLRMHGDYSARQATVEGLNGNIKDKWDTDSDTIGGGIDAVFVF